MPDPRDCCLCSQIAGRAERDLIAGMLPGQPYARRVMAESDAFAVIPSLGPLAPGHSLLCPRDHVRSFAELRPGLEAECADLAASLSARLAGLYGVEIHVFEHGMAAHGTRTLCTVDHAHLHFVPLPRTCAPVVPGDPRWSSWDGSLDALRELAAGREYFAYRKPDGTARVLATDEGELESQLMRKMLGRANGTPEQWDWRARPDAAAADATWRRFVGLAAAGAGGTAELA